MQPPRTSEMEDRKTIKVIRLVLVGLVAAFLLFWGFVWSTFDVSGAGRYSIALRVGAPAHLRSVELVAECRDPKYRWKGRDGAGAPFSSVTYGSLAPGVDILKEYESIYKNKSCKNNSSISNSNSLIILNMDCENSDFLTARVFLSGDGVCKDVTVEFLGNE